MGRVLTGLPNSEVVPGLKEKVVCLRAGDGACVDRAA